MLRNEAEKNVSTSNVFLREQSHLRTRFLCLICVRDANTVLREQVCECLDEKVTRSSGETHEYSNAPNSETGSKACSAVETFIQCSNYTSLLWKTFDSDRIMYFVGCQQIFSDKTQVSLSAESLQFYVLHVSFLNFSKERRRKLVSNGNFVAYFPFKFETRNVFFSQHSTVADDSNYMSKMKELNALHASIEILLRLLLMVFEKGFPVVTKYE